MTIRIIGIGNDYASDDSAGLRLARALRESLASVIEVLEESGEGAALMAAWEGADAAILCDAVSSGTAPGTVHRIDAAREPMPKEMRPCSSHAFGVAQAVELGRTLGTLPPTFVIYGIEGERFDAGTECSPATLSGISRAKRRIEEEVRRLMTPHSDAC